MSAKRVLGWFVLPSLVPVCIVFRGLTNRTGLEHAVKYGCNENAFPESALVRRLRWGCGFTLPGDARGLVFLVSDAARISGRHDSGCPSARRSAAQLYRRNDSQRGEELRPG